MSKSGRSLLVAVAGLTLLCASACSNTPPRVEQPGISSSASSDAMKQYDTDGDGKIAGEELDKAPALKGSLANLDANGDGAISADEIDTRIAAWEESKLGRTSVMITVTRNGTPLSGATVKLIPEKFLGESIQPAEGISNEWGTATPSIASGGDADALDGMQVGFYRAEITKSDEEIPAKYNTETELGFEVAQDMEGAEEGIRFDLKY
jgi:hypothetical protein